MVFLLLLPGDSISAQNQATADSPLPSATPGGEIILTPTFIDEVPTAVTTNFDPVQFEQGRQAFARYCATCHGSQGQGLDKWRSSWDAEHQNCAKPTCHGYAHPPEGFLMLKIAPPLIGPGSLGKFSNALALYVYIHALMPFEDPGGLSEDKYWAITAFLSDQHGANGQGVTLNANNAVSVTLP